MQRRRVGKVFLIRAVMFNVGGLCDSQLIFHRVVVVCDGRNGSVVRSDDHTSRKYYIQYTERYTNGNEPFEMRGGESKSKFG
jgi:hypothetical protein